MTLGVLPVQKVVGVEIVHETHQIAVHDVRVGVDGLAGGSSGRASRLRRRGFGWTG